MKFGEKQLRELVKSGKYTNEQWNQYSLYRYVDYINRVPLSKKDLLITK